MPQRSGAKLWRFGFAGLGSRRQSANYADIDFSGHPRKITEAAPRIRERLRLCHGPPLTLTYRVATNSRHTSFLVRRSCQTA